MKRLIIFLLAALMLAALVSCKNKDEDGMSGLSDVTINTPAPEEKVKLPDVVTGSMTIKDYGVVTFEIYPNKAPQSALNFIYLVNTGHFNGVIIDRVVKNYIVQAGDYESGYVRRNTEFDYTINGEFKENGFDNDLRFSNGAICWMYDGTDFNGAHTSFAIFPDSNSSWGLEGKYAVFGYVTGEDSLKIISKISKKKSYQERPEKEIMILSVVLNPIEQDGFGADYVFPEPDFIKR